MTDTEAAQRKNRGTSLQPAELHWDPFDPDLKVDPYPIWRRLRDEAS